MASSVYADFTFVGSQKWLLIIENILKKQNETLSLGNFNNNHPDFKVEDFIFGKSDYEQNWGEKKWKTFYTKHPLKGLTLSTLENDKIQITFFNAGYSMCEWAKNATKIFKELHPNEEARVNIEIRENGFGNDFLNIKNGLVVGKFHYDLQYEEIFEDVETAHLHIPDHFLNEAIQKT